MRAASPLTASQSVTPTLRRGPCAFSNGEPNAGDRAWTPDQVRHDGKRWHEHGFTLVELMVVITVMALVAGAAALALPDPSGRVRDEAERFAARTRAAQQEAIIAAAPVSLWVTAGGYGFDQRRGGAWSPITEKPLRVERWREGTRADLPAVSGRQRVTFDVTGLADRPLDLRLTRDRASALVRVEADGSVRVNAG